MGRVYSDSESVRREEKISPFPEYHSDDDLHSLGFHYVAEGEGGEGKKKDPRLKKKKKMKKRSQVLLEGYVEDGEEEQGMRGLARTKSLTGDDLDELKGCLDLGFGFSYEEIPELCNTLPALELCYSMSQRFLDEQQHKSPEASSTASSQPCSSTSSPIANWRISRPGDHPEDVKARLKFWAQAVACTVRLCS